MPTSTTETTNNLTNDLWKSYNYRIDSIELALGINNSNNASSTANQAKQTTEEAEIANNDSRYKKEMDKAANAININRLDAIEALPYQFLESVDRRLEYLSKNKKKTKGTTGIGRKYNEKILSRMPLVFLMPCIPKFMYGANEADTSVSLAGSLASIGNVLASNPQEILSLLGNDYKNERTARYYGTKFAYAKYYDYLQVMLSTLIHYLGIGDEEVYFNGTLQALKDINWIEQNTSEDSLAMYYSGGESLAFYMDGIDSISENYSNDTTLPSIANDFNSKGEEARELRFLFGDNASMAAGILGVKTIYNKVTSLFKFGTTEEGGTTIGLGDAEGLFDTATNYIGSAMYRDLLGNAPCTILQGGRLVFPEIWSDSSYSKNYNISIKLRSPDHDTVSIFMNILVPYCKLLALTLPHTDNTVNIMEDEDLDTSYMNPNTYFSPFILKAFSPGTINIDMGIIDSLSVSKGATCQWNVDGLPTQIDIDVSIKDLYHTLAMSGWSEGTLGLGLNLSKIWATVSNTSYMDFLANMAGLNVKDTHRRKMDLAQDLVVNKIKNTGARIISNLTNTVSNWVKGYYDI